MINKNSSENQALTFLKIACSHVSKNANGFNAVSLVETLPHATYLSILKKNITKKIFFSQSYHINRHS